jgi:hypothetical protein
MLAFISDQLDRRRTYRLELEREQTRRVELRQCRDTMIWRQLQGDHQQPTNQGQP